MQMIEEGCLCGGNLYWDPIRGIYRCGDVYFVDGRAYECGRRYTYRQGKLMLV